jgi:hypothetical protein
MGWNAEADKVKPLADEERAKNFLKKSSRTSNFSREVPSR